MLLNYKCLAFDICCTLYILGFDYPICPFFKAKFQKLVKEIFIIFHLFSEPEEAGEAEEVEGEVEEEDPD